MFRAKVRLKWGCVIILFMTDTKTNTTFNSRVAYIATHDGEKENNNCFILIHDFTAFHCAYFRTYAGLWHLNALSRKLRNQPDGQIAHLPFCCVIISHRWKNWLILAALSAKPQIIHQTFFQQIKCKLCINVHTWTNMHCWTLEVRLNTITIYIINNNNYSNQLLINNWPNIIWLFAAIVFFTLSPLLSLSTGRGRGHPHVASDLMFRGFWAPWFLEGDQQL